MIALLGSINTFEVLFALELNTFVIVLSLIVVLVG